MEGSKAVQQFAFLGRKETMNFHEWLYTKSLEERRAIRAAERAWIRSRVRPEDDPVWRNFYESFFGFSEGSVIRGGELA